MGIYLFNRDVLVDVLRQIDASGLWQEVFPSLIDPKHVQVHLFDGYWEDIGTIRAFYEANLQLASDRPPSIWCRPKRRSIRGPAFCRRHESTERPSAAV